MYMNSYNSYSYAAMNGYVNPRQTVNVSYRIMYVLKVKYCKGQPVAWAIMDTEDTSTYFEFFTALKARVPEAVVQTIMTNDGNNIAII